MFFPNASSETLDALLAQIKKSNAEIINQISFEKPEILHERGTDFTSIAKKDSSLHLITSGEVTLFLGDRALLIYEKGDIVGIESLLPIPCSAVSKDFAIKAQSISVLEIEEQLGSQTLLVLLSNISALFAQAFAVSLPSEDNFEPDIKRYKAGEVIVDQGSFGEEIFTLIEGHADVFVDGKKVGEIKNDEVFGALAAMTNIARTATIKASEDILVLSIKKDQLIDLIKMRPGTVEKMIGDLARVIQDLNKQISAPK